MIEDVLTAVDPVYLWDNLDPVWDREYLEWATKNMNELGTSAAFNMMDPNVISYFQDFKFDRIQDLVNDGTREALKAELIAGIKEGESYDDLQKRVKTVFFEGNMDVNSVRSWRVAKTETNRAVGNADQNSYRQSGVVEKKQWIPEYNNTRESHEALGMDPVASVVNINDYFTSPFSGNSAQYPGDFGIAEEDINCNCRILPMIDEPKAASEFEKISKAYEKEREAWDEAAFKALKKGFNQQYNAALKALKDNLKE